MYSHMETINLKPCKSLAATLQTRKYRQFLKKLALALKWLGFSKIIDNGLHFFYMYDMISTTIWFLTRNQDSF